MKYSKLLLATLAGTAGLAAVASQAMPFNMQRLGDAAAQVLNVDFREHDDDDDHREGHRRHGDDDRRQAANDCGRQGQDDDDDDDKGGDDCVGHGADVNQSVNPPSNGLFTPGSKPRVQMN